MDKKSFKLLLVGEDFNSSSATTISGDSSGPGDDDSQDLQQVETLECLDIRNVIEKTNAVTVHEIILPSNSQQTHHMEVENGYIIEEGELEAEAEAEEGYMGEDEHEKNLSNIFKQKMAQIIEKGKGITKKKHKSKSNLKKDRAKKFATNKTKFNEPLQLDKMEIEKDTIASLVFNKADGSGKKEILNEVAFIPKDLTTVTVHKNDTRLICVDYPGIVIHPTRAVRTLGGIQTVNEIFTHKRKRLPLRFRPGDIYCNPTNGSIKKVCGLLVKVRRKKDKSKPDAVIIEEEDDDDLDDDLDLDLDKSKKNNNFSIDPTKLTKEDFLKEEEEMLENFEKIEEEVSEAKFCLKVPSAIPEPQPSKISLEMHGIVETSYEFNGLCDFQYLPAKTTDDGLVPILDSICPVFDQPKDQVVDLEEEFEGKYNNVEEFFVPSIMSRIDKPHRSFIALMEEPKIENETIPLQTRVLTTVRPRRIIYTHMHNFKDTDDDYSHTSDILVPTEPFPQALEEVDKKRYNETGSLDKLRELFEQRPIWAKQGVEFHTEINPIRLKYLLPCVAYFSLNGPWRSFWIKFGHDPRKDINSYQYQLLDYRLPLEFRNLTKGLLSNNPLFNYIYEEGVIPPKIQMFYQLCDIKIKEVEEINGIMTVRLNKKPIFTPRFGFLDEELMDYCRYSISRYIDQFLFDLGKIKKRYFPPVDLISSATPSVSFKARQQIAKAQALPKLKKEPTKKSSKRRRKPRKKDEEENEIEKEKEKDKNKDKDKKKKKDKVLADFFTDNEEEEETQTEDEQEGEKGKRKKSKEKKTNGDGDIEDEESEEELEGEGEDSGDETYIGKQLKEFNIEDLEDEDDDEIDDQDPVIEAILTCQPE